VAVI